MRRLVALVSLVALPACLGAWQDTDPRTTVRALVDAGKLDEAIAAVKADVAADATNKERDAQFLQIGRAHV